MPKDPCERLRLYILNFRESLKTLKIVSQECIRVIELALRYLEDSEYYLGKGDCVTGLVTISYAEGLLDALRMLGAIEWRWARGRERIVLVAGSFDLLHPGHIEFLKWASSLGDKLYVVIARDSTYRRLRKREPVLSEGERLAIVSAIRFVYKAVLGSETDMLEPVAKIRPDVIALGPDQLDVEALRSILKERGLEGIDVVKMGQKYGSYSSSLVKKRVCDTFCLHVEG